MTSKEIKFLTYLYETELEALWGGEHENEVGRISLIRQEFIQQYNLEDEIYNSGDNE